MPPRKQTTSTNARGPYSCHRFLQSQGRPTTFQGPYSARGPYRCQGSPELPQFPAGPGETRHFPGSLRCQGILQLPGVPPVASVSCSAGEYQQFPGSPHYQGFLQLQGVPTVARGTYRCEGFPQLIVGGLKITASLPLNCIHDLTRDAINTPGCLQPKLEQPGRVVSTPPVIHREVKGIWANGYDHSYVQTNERQREMAPAIFGSGNARVQERHDAICHTASELTCERTAKRKIRGASCAEKLYRKSFKKRKQEKGERGGEVGQEKAGQDKPKQDKTRQNKTNRPKKGGRKRE